MRLAQVVLKKVVRQKQDYILIGIKIALRGGIGIYMR